MHKYLIPAIYNVWYMFPYPERRMAFMETAQRTLLKTTTWQVIGIATMMIIAYPHTESLLDALTLSLTSSTSGLILFMVHERIWNAVRWGRR